MPMAVLFAFVGVLIIAKDLLFGLWRDSLWVLGVMTVGAGVMALSARYPTKVLATRRGLEIATPFKRRSYPWDEVQSMTETASVFWMFHHVYEITFHEAERRVVFLGKPSALTTFEQMKAAVRPPPRLRGSSPNPHCHALAMGTVRR
jgi:hypothetical protein